ncbi:autotransporter outer membrane beta-barrel domain-containing protein, partial [Cereibacter changlensis JA139]
GWRHAFGDLDEGVSADLLGSDFVAYGMPIAKNELLLEAGLEMPLSGSSTFSVGYSGQFSEDHHDHGLKAALQVAF